MKPTKRSVLNGLTAILAAVVILYAYRVARAERHRAFDRACAAGDIARVSWLLRLGADPHGVRDATYYSRYAWTVFETTPPLHLAASGGHTEIVRLLLAHGADPSVTDSERLTARDRARLSGHTDIVQLLATHSTQ